MDYATLLNIEAMREMMEELQNLPGEGLYGKIEGTHFYIGNYRISLRAGCKENIDNELNKMEGKASGFIYMGTTLVGTFGLSDDSRSGAMEAIKELIEAGIITVMLTGDNHVAAQHEQYQLERALDIVHASLLPWDLGVFGRRQRHDGTRKMTETSAKGGWLVAIYAGKGNHRRAELGLK